MKCQMCDKPNATCWIDAKHVCRVCFYQERLNKPMNKVARGKVNIKIRDSLLSHHKAIREVKNEENTKPSHNIPK